MIRVLVVNDSSLLRWALAACLELQPDIESYPASWRQAAELARERRPEVCVADLDRDNAKRCVGHTEGADRQLAAELAELGCSLVALVPPRRPGLVRRAADLGVACVMSTDIPPARLVTAIRHTAVGRRFAAPPPPCDETEGAPLTSAELRVLARAAEGASTKEIARDLHLANGTVRNYIAAITRKLGARNRVDAIRISHAAGWI